MRSATRLLIVALTALALALPLSAPATAEENPVPVIDQVVAEQPTPPATPDATAPSGPELEPAETAADRSETRRKLVMGIASVVLLGIVIWGRSVRRKR